MASAPRVEFFPALATVVVETASALLTSARPALRHADALSVEAAWTRTDCTSYAGQTRAAPILALVKVLQMAHDEAPDPVFWSTPEEELAERTQGKERRGDTRDRGDHIRGGGGSGGDDHHPRRGGGSGVAGEGSASGAGGGSGRRRGVTLAATTGAVAAALTEATNGGGTVREDVQRETARPARIRPRARTTARWPW